MLSCVHSGISPTILAGEPAISVKGGTTVSGGSTVLSAIAQQSFNTQRRPMTQFFPMYTYDPGMESEEMTFVVEPLFYYIF